MVREALKKLFRRSSTDQEREPDKRIEDVRADAHDKASEINPGHSDQAAQIGMFS
jgi:hypothetical protein